MSNVGDFWKLEEWLDISLIIKNLGNLKRTEEMLSLKLCENESTAPV